MDKFVKDILNFISRNTSGASFYQIVRGFGFPDAPYDLQAILRSLAEERLVEIAHPDAGANAKYSITAKGVDALKDTCS